MSADHQQDLLDVEAQCFYCFAPATRLCDGHIGSLYGGFGKYAGRPPYPVIDTRHPEKAVFTCDRPLCDSCVASQSPRLFCGPQGCNPIDHDLCKQCKRDSETGEAHETPVLTFPDVALLRARRDFQEKQPKLSFARKS